MKNIITTNNLVVIKEFLYTTPTNYDHKRQLSNFLNNSGEFKEIELPLEDKKFLAVSHKIEPNRKYLIKIYEVRDVLWIEDTILYLSERGTLFTGAQGLTLIWQSKLYPWPKPVWVLSLDKRENLFSREPNTWCLIPLIYEHPHPLVGLRLSYARLGVDLDYGNQIITFNDI